MQTNAMKMKISNEIDQLLLDETKGRKVNRIFSKSQVSLLNKEVLKYWNGYF